MDKNQLLIVMLFCSTLLAGQNTDSTEFESLDHSAAWQLAFEDECTDNWQSKWFLDGLRAEVKNTEEGMVFSAGDVAEDDACHAVLWTKESFSGDVKIAYHYTRTDTRTQWVNILYIQASGIPPYARDIAAWKAQRIIPYMRTYFMNMEALHISYAAYGNNNTDSGNDYIRVRKYPSLPGQSFSTTTEIPPTSFKTGLFKPGETYKVTVIKTSNKLYFKVAGKDGSKLFSWDLSENQTVSEGRIGLRHMYTRSALYKDFEIYRKD